MTSSSSSGRSRSKNGEGDMARFFDSKAKSKCWTNAEVASGRHPDGWRKDAAGNIVCKRFCNSQGCLCFEYDHNVPFSKGLVLINPFCPFHFSNKELDIIEMAVYGDVIRPGNQCRRRTVAEMLGKIKSKDSLAACGLFVKDGSNSSAFHHFKMRIGASENGRKHE
ncbi:hypothetical protein V6N13_099485 [Hibiscus sabdariffa]